MDINTLIGLQGSSGLLLVVLLALFWKLIWYGLALFQTIEKKQKSWFVVLFIATFILNDLGILAIIYLIINKKPAKKKKR